jgi:hypothetical protein
MATTIDALERDPNQDRARAPKRADAVVTEIPTWVEIGCYSHHL